MASAVQNWGEILRTQNLSSDEAMDTVSRWLLITRASVFPMTVISAAIGGLLALAAPDAHGVYFDEETSVLSAGEETGRR